VKRKTLEVGDRVATKDGEEFVSAYVPAKCVRPQAKGEA
jgi:hypothetical protein